MSPSDTKGMGDWAEVYIGTSPFQRWIARYRINSCVMLAAISWLALASAPFSVSRASARPCAYVPDHVCALPQP